MPTCHNEDKINAGNLIAYININAIFIDAMFLDLVPVYHQVLWSIQLDVMWINPSRLFRTILIMCAIRS